MLLTLSLREFRPSSLFGIFPIQDLHQEAHQQVSKDLNILMAKEKDSLLFGDCTVLINNLTFYSAAVNEIENLEFELSNILGNLFNKEDTNFDRVYSDIATAEKLVQRSL